MKRAKLIPLMVFLAVLAMSSPVEAEEGWDQMWMVATCTGSDKRIALEAVEADCEGWNPGPSYVACTPRRSADESVDRAEVRAHRSIQTMASDDSLHGVSYIIGVGKCWVCVRRPFDKMPYPAATEVVEEVAEIVVQDEEPDVDKVTATDSPDDESRRNAVFVPMVWEGEFSVQWRGKMAPPMVRLWGKYPSGDQWSFDLTPDRRKRDWWIYEIPNRVVSRYVRFTISVKGGVAIWSIEPLNRGALKGGVPQPAQFVTEHAPPDVVHRCGTDLGWCGPIQAGRIWSIYFHANEKFIGQEK